MTMKKMILTLVTMLAVTLCHAANLTPEYAFAINADAVTVTATPLEAYAFAIDVDAVTVTAPAMEAYAFAIDAGAVTVTATSLEACAFAIDVDAVTVTAPAVVLEEVMFAEAAADEAPLADLD